MIETLTEQQKYILGLFSYVSSRETGDLIYQIEEMVGDMAVKHSREYSSGEVKNKPWRYIMQELEPDYLMQEELEQTYLVHMFSELAAGEQENVLAYVEEFLSHKAQEECWSTAEEVVKWKRDIDRMLRELDE